MFVDPNLYLANRRQDLLAEAARERLVSQLPQTHSTVRHDLALACVRLANWLDHADQYFSQPESGPEDWAGHSANV
jgi:hypothetical protein